MAGGYFHLFGVFPQVPPGQVVDQRSKLTEGCDGRAAAHIHRSAEGYEHMSHPMSTAVLRVYTAENPCFGMLITHLIEARPNETY